MNHGIREHNKNLLFLVRDPVLTTVSATTAYAGKMLWDRALLFRFTNWLIGIWPAAWQSHKSGMKPCSTQLPEMWSTCHLWRGREWLGCMALLCLVLGWMEQGMQEEFWRDWCRIGWEGVSHGEDQLLITRSVQVVEQRSVFPVFSVRKWTRSLRACQQTQAPVCGRLRALPWDSCLYPRVCKQERPACPGQGAFVLAVSLSSTWECTECCVDDGNHSPAWGFNPQVADPRESGVLQLPSRGNVSPLPAKEKPQLNSYKVCPGHAWRQKKPRVFGNIRCTVAFLFLLLEFF